MKQIALFFLTLIAVAVIPTANAAGPWQRMPSNIKLPSQQVIEAQLWVNPAAASSTYYKSGGALTNGSATTFTGLTAPDYARNVVLTPGGTTANIGAGTAVVTGTAINGKVISENFTISAAQSSASTGSKAFATITSVQFPAATGSGATLSIGTGTKLGLKRCVADAGNYGWSSFGGAYDSTRGTLAADAANMEGNTFISNSSLDGAHNVQLFYVQNYACY